jgi:hypothetical protein
MDGAYRCPYDGLRMTNVGGESAGDGWAWHYYECPECGHEGVEVVYGDFHRVRSLVMCPCKGCSAERHRTGSIILKEDDNG